jgi:hypothetical protein
MKYFKHCYQIEQAHELGCPTFMSLQFPFADESLDIPKGSFLIPGLHCINEISNVNEKAGDEIGEAKQFLNNGRGGWVNLLKQILKHPDEMSEQMDFQDTEHGD